MLFDRPPDSVDTECNYHQMLSNDRVHVHPVHILYSGLEATKVPLLEGCPSLTSIYQSITPTVHPS